jgi:hypothetical protein
LDQLFSETVSPGAKMTGKSAVYSRFASDWEQFLLLIILWKFGQDWGRSAMFAFLQCDYL